MSINKIEQFFRRTNNDHHENPEVSLEGGRYYVRCSACGSTWAYNKGIFQIIETGNESCNQMNEEQDHEMYGSGTLERPEE